MVDHTEDEQDLPPQETEDTMRPRSALLHEIMVLILLAITAVTTAWCGFESAKWGGEMSIAFSEASSARITAARAQGMANNARQIDVSLWVLFVQAKAQSDVPLAKYVEDRFTDRFLPAYEEWKRSGRAEGSPFEMAEYSPPGEADAAAADQRADQRFSDALLYNERGDQYALLTVLFALVLFFAAIAPRPTRPALRWLLLGLAALTFLTGVILMLRMPVLI